MRLKRWKLHKAGSIPRRRGRSMFRGGAAQGDDSTSACAPVIGRLHAVVGSVAITRTSASIARAVIGDVIYEGDQIEAGIDGLAIILFVDGTTFQLDAGTHLAVNEFPCGVKGTSEGALFRIISGAFRFIAGKRASMARSSILLSEVSGAMAELRALEA